MTSLMKCEKRRQVALLTADRVVREARPERNEGGVAGACAHVRVAELPSFGQRYLCSRGSQISAKLALKLRVVKR